MKLLGNFDRVVVGVVVGVVVVGVVVGKRFLIVLIKGAQICQKP